MQPSKKADCVRVILGKIQVTKETLPLSVDPRIHQTIDIIIVDIPEAHGMWLSRDWLENIKGYFATDWSHLWLPYNVRSNQINIVREPYLK